MACVSGRRPGQLQRSVLIVPHMFDQLEPRQSTIVRISVRLVISLAAGAVLNLLVPLALGAVWPYLQDRSFRPFGFAVFIARVLNLPAVIYCRFFSLPSGLPKSDESLYCSSVAFFFNIPYYAIVIFVLWSLLGWVIRRGRRAGSPALAH
jgi:hypothetical protein